MEKHIRQGRYTAKRTRLEQTKMWFGDRYRAWKQIPLWKRILIIVIPILVVLIVIPTIFYFQYANDIGDRERLMNRNNTGIVLTDVTGKTIYSIGRAEKRQFVELKDMPKHLQQALLASEDKDFYSHGGFNPASIARALFSNISSGDMNAYGGSTLTQQLAKNTLLSDQKSFMRKYQELAVSVAIEQKYTKDDILAMYLNSVYYGENAFGIDEAAKIYFNKAPKDLTLAESAMLVGVLPAPSAYSPVSGKKDLAKQRQKTVLERMQRNAFITNEQMKSALDTQLAYAPPQEINSRAPHFVEMVMNRINKEYGAGSVQRAGYRVTTTLNLDMQDKLEAAVASNMKTIQRSGGSNAGAVAIDPKTGEIRALVGSADWKNEQWGKVNMALTPRQPGSSYKTIYYAAALADGVITPATVMKDERTDFGGYVPLNADKQWHGDVTIRSAISQSLNIPSVKVMQAYGIDRSIDASKKIGLSLDENKQYGLSLALGVAEQPLLTMTNAYATYANQGTEYTNSSIKSISDRYNNVIFTQKSEGKEVINPAGAYLISNILSDQSARAPIFGGSLSLNNRLAAVKTGTTENARDAWTIGYTSSLAVGVWVGNNDNAPMSNGGSGMAGPIWRNAMNTMLAGTPNEQFAVPANVVRKATCSSNHGIATTDVTEGTYQEYYVSTALPTVTCSPKKVVKIDVCELATKKMINIDEEAFDATLHSKDAELCKEVIKIKVCELAKGTITEIDEKLFDATKYSKITSTSTTCTATSSPTTPTSPTTPPSSTGGTGTPSPGMGQTTP